MGAKKCPERVSLFVSSTRQLFGNFATTDFHQFRPRHVNHGWNAKFGQKFMKISIQGSFAPKTSNFEGVKQVPYSEQATGQGIHCRDTVYSTLWSKSQEVSDIWSTFLYDVWLQSYGASKLHNFRILAYFPHTKPVKCTFRWPAYSPGVTSQNDSDFSMW